MSDVPRYASFTGTNGRAIYVNPENVAAVIDKDGHSTLVLVGDFFYDVTASADNVRKTLGWV